MTDFKIPRMQSLFGIPDRRTVASGLCVLGTLLLLLIFRDTVASAVGVWRGDASFGHGFLIVPIVLFLVWQRRHQLAGLEPDPSAWGLLLIAVAAIAWVLGEAASVNVVQQFAFVGMFQGLVVAVFGVRVTRLLLFPLVFLYFAVPFGAFAIPYLQTFTAELVVRLVRVIGVPVYHDGVFIHLPNSSFEVAVACAGLRYLISTIVLATLAANLFFHSAKKRILFVAISVVAAIFGNGIRAFSIVMLVFYSDSKYGVEHNTFSLVMMSTITLVLFLGAMKFREAPRARRIELEKPGTTGGRYPVRLVGAALASLLVVGSARAYAGLIIDRTVANEELRLAMPDVVGVWKHISEAPEWTPSLDRAALQAKRSYVNDVETADLFVAVYSGLPDEGEIVAYENAFFGGDGWRRVADWSSTVELADRVIKVSSLQITSASGGRIIWYWYFVDDTRTTSPYLVKALRAKQRLLGGSRQSIVVAVSAPYESDPVEATNILANFVGAMPDIRTLIVGDTPGILAGLNN